MSAAVKVVPLALASHDIEERFRRERQFLASLDHPKVARLIDGGVSEAGLPYLVMEFAGGLAIDQFCESRQMDTRGRIVLMRQVLEALAYVHSRQVIHRDVKPSNIVVDEAGSVKLLDFGTARLADATAEMALTKTGLFAFTPEYASPEQVRGEPAGTASDLYSAGVLLYRLLTGHLPYRMADPSPAAVAQVIARTQPEPSRLEAPLDAILSKALRKDAGGRYQSAAEMDADLERYLGGQRVSARLPRKKFGAVTAAAIVAAAAGVLGIRALRAPDTRTIVPFEAGVPNAMQPALPRDGKWVAFAAAGQGARHPDIWLKPMAGGAAWRLTSGESANDEPSLSPDDRWLAFHSTRSPDGIYVQPVAGGPPRLLVEGGREPRFSPDGKWIAYLNTSEDVGDLVASNASMLYRVPAEGGTPVRLARNVPSVQGVAWNDDSRSLLLLSLDEGSLLRLWSAPLDGGPAVLIPEFRDLLSGDAHACADTGGRFLYTALAGEDRSLIEFSRHLNAGAVRRSLPSPAQLDMTACTADAHGHILGGAVENVSGAWALPMDAKTGSIRGPLAPVTELARGDHHIKCTPDGAACLLSAGAGASYLQDYRTGARRLLPGAYVLSADGVFVLRISTPTTMANPGVWEILDLKTGNSWGHMQTQTAPWALSRGGQWLLTANAEGHRVVLAWDTHTAEHQTVYARPDANLYLASFSEDARWVLLVAQENGRLPHMWAAPFHGLSNVPPSTWVDPGEGDYPCWSPAGHRIYFTETQDGFECIYTRTVDPLTKRPTGPAIAVEHLHGSLTPKGMRPGSFRLSAARDKLVFPLGEQRHHLFQWR